MLCSHAGCSNEAGFLPSITLYISGEAPITTLFDLPVCDKCRSVFIETMIGRMAKSMQDGARRVGFAINDDDTTWEMVPIGGGINVKDKSEQIGRIVTRSFGN